MGVMPQNHYHMLKTKHYPDVREHARRIGITPEEYIGYVQELYDSIEEWYDHMDELERIVNDMDGEWD